MQNNKNISHLLEIFDIAKYAVFVEDGQTYRKASQMLYHDFDLYIQKQLKDESIRQKGLSFTDEQVDLMKLILNMISKKEQNYFAKDSWLINVWFNPTIYIPWSEDARCFIWFFVTNIIEADKDEWFMSYWTFADQYYRFQLDHGCENVNHEDSFKEQQLSFKEFHIALGAFLLYKKKYALLNKVMYFSQTIPPEYALIDNTFSQILNHFLSFKKQENGLAVLTKKYMMSGLENDLKSDTLICDQICIYLSIMMLRLSKMDWNVSYCDPYDFPNIDAEEHTQNLEQQILFCEVIRRNLENELSQNFNFKNLWDEGRENCLKVLEQYENNIQDI